MIMDIELTTECLDKLCRICLNEGEFSIQNHRIKRAVPKRKASSAGYHVRPNGTEYEEEVISMQEMLLIFDQEKINILEKSKSPQLLCHSCVKQLLSCYLFYKQIVKGCKKLKRLYVEALSETNSTTNDQNIEFLEDSNEFDSIQVTTVKEEDSEEQIEPNILDDDTSKDSADVYAQPVTEVNQEIKVENTNFTFKRHFSEMQRKPKNQIAKSAKSTLLDFEKASLVVTQFLPTAAEIRTNLPSNTSQFENGDTENNTLRTIDYAAVEVDASNYEEMIEDDQDYMNINDTSKSVYYCQYCPQAYSAPHYLISHIRKTHVCKFCTQTFAQTTDLHEHIRSIHIQHICAICGKELSSQGNLRTHIKRVHGLNLPAQVTLLDYKLTEPSDTSN